MAKQYGLDSAVDFAAANLMSFGKSFSRLSGQPLDKSEIWYNDLDALKAYALTDAAYVGQKVVYVDTTANTVTHYSIELDGSLKELGTTPIGDNKSIVVDGDGVISLNKFGVEYYRLLTSDEEGYVEGQATYVLQIVDETHPWKSGLVPRVLDGSIAWYEPSNVTVEGLNDTVGTLQTAVEAAEKNIADNKAAYDAYVETHTYTDEQIDAKVSGAFHFRGTATLETNDDGAWTGNLINSEGAVIVNPDNGDVYQVGEEEYAYDGNTWVKLGFSLDLTGYATKVELNTAKTDLSAKDTELEGEIDGLRTDVDAINNAETGILKTAKDYTDSKITDLNIDQYATTEALGQTNEAVAGNTATIGEHKTLIDAATATANNAATKEVVEAIDGRLTTVEGVIGTLQSDVSTNKSDISNIKAEQITQNNAIEKNKTDLAALTQTVGTATSDLSTLTGRVDSIEGTANKNTSDISELSTRVDGINGTVEGHTTNIGKNTSDIAANTSLINGIDGRLTTAEGEIDTLQSDVSTNKSDIATLRAAIGTPTPNTDAGENGFATGIYKDIEDLTGVVNAKADANKVYTKEETAIEINKAIVAADHLKRSVVNELPAVADADVNTIYMVFDNTVVGADKYNEWIIIDGTDGKEWACIGDTTVDLTDYVQKDDETYTGALADITALKEAKSEANVLEAVKVNGTVLEIVDKAINIGIATDSVLGVVLGSAAENKVAVAADGTMEVNSINVNKLVQTAGEQLILNGGNATN